MCEGSGERMLTCKRAASLGAMGVIGAVVVGLAVPAGAATSWCPPPVTTTSTSYCSQGPSEPLTITTVTRQVTLPGGSGSTFARGLAKVSGGPNGRTFTLPLFYKATPPSPTEPSDDPTTYAGRAVIGNAEVLGFGGPIYLEGGTASVNHYGSAAVTSGPSLDLCVALGY